MPIHHYFLYALYAMAFVAVVAFLVQYSFDKYYG